MNDLNETDDLDAASKAFIDATNAVIEIWYKYTPQPSRITLTNEFSRILLKIYQIFMLDLMPSFQCLTLNKKFYSFSILCRSLFDISIQLEWILSLKGMEQDNAISEFLNFNGVGIGKNGKPFYDWQEEINKKSTRQTAIDLGVDEVTIPLSLSSYNSSGLVITCFDYLSKITHWNPKLINDLVGLNAENHLGFSVEYLRMAVLSLDTSLRCILVFTEHFIEYCLNVDKITIRSETSRIRETFRKSIAPFFDNTVATNDP